MADQHSGPPVPQTQPGMVLSWLKDFFRQFQLAWRLMKDPRIPWGYKLIPFATAAYVISPVDLIPGAVLGLGQLDDVAVLLIGLKFFIDLCPPDIVEEHRLALQGTAVTATWVPPQDASVIDVEPEVPPTETPQN